VKTLAVLAVVVLLAWGWTHHQRSVTEHRLAAVASELAGRSVGVRCQGFWAEMLDIGQRTGEVDFPPDRPPDHMFLTRPICKHLRSFTDGHRGSLDCLTTIDWSHWSVPANYNDACARQARPTAEAITTLAHESMHLRGITNEAQAQCQAIRADAWTTVRLGGSEAQGAAVAAFALALQPAMPEEYQSGCRLSG
jgi:hypothetical protein